MPTFGIVAEGPADQAILENILIGHFKDADLIVRPLQPLRDATDKIESFGNWYNVFEYCRSSVFKEAFQQNDYLVIQIDTDCSHEKNYDVPPISGETAEVFIERIIAKFVGIFQTSFGHDFWETYQSKILFAISVDEIECWLLPLFYTNKTREATNNCFYKLNEALIKDKQKPIPSNKDNAYRLYDKLSREYSKPKSLKNRYSQNPSFRYFVEQYLHPIPASET